MNANANRARSPYPYGLIRLTSQVLYSPPAITIWFDAMTDSDKTAE